MPKETMINESPYEKIERLERENKQLTTDLVNARQRIVELEDYIDDLQMDIVAPYTPTGKEVVRVHE